MFKLRFLPQSLNKLTAKDTKASQLLLVKCYNKFQQRDSRPSDEEYQSSSLANYFGSMEVKTIEDWKFIKKELVAGVRQITTANFDSLALGYCIKNKNYNLAEVCLKFIQEENTSLNLGVSGKVFLLYQAMYENKSFKGDYEDTVFKMYENIRSKYKLLDSLTLEAAIIALSSTKHWKLCLDLLKEIKISCIPNTMSYNVLAAAAFKNKEYVTGWNIIDEMMSNNRPTVDTFYKAVLTDCLENKHRDNFQKLLNFFNNNDIIATAEIVKLIEQVAKSFYFEAKTALVSEIGKCSKCDKYLPRLELSPNEFDELKKAFFEEVIIGKNVYCKTTPDEVERFNEFLMKSKKYNVVIDGLNVAYATGSTNAMVQSSTLSAVVDHFASRKKQILVLGRQHMQKWPRKNMQNINHNADVFLTQNLSYDDPYLLYCALNSGQNTIIITRDYMRNHLHLLKNDDHKRLFRRWLVQCRHEFVRVQQSGKVIFSKPLPFLQVCQESQFGWHVPYLLDGEIISNTHRIQNWLCMQKPEF